MKLYVCLATAVVICNTVVDGFTSSDEQKEKKCKYNLLFHMFDQRPFLILLAVASFEQDQFSIKGSFPQASPLITGESARRKTKWKKRGKIKKKMMKIESNHYINK